MNERPHPWSAFLNARYFAILWMREEMAYSDERIAHDLSMDTMQVWLIRTSKHMPIPEGKYNKESPQ